MRAVCPPLIQYLSIDDMCSIVLGIGTMLENGQLHTELVLWLKNQLANDQHPYKLCGLQGTLPVTSEHT